MFTRAFYQRRNFLLRAARKPYNLHNMTSELDIKRVMQAMAKRRWSKVSKAERSKHGRALAEARHGKKRTKRNVA